MMQRRYEIFTKYIMIFKGIDKTSQYTQIHN